VTEARPRGCAGLCAPGAATCPTPGQCDVPPADPPPAPPPTWLEELHKVRVEMLAHLRTIPLTKDLHWKRMAMRGDVRLKLAHKLLRELRAGADPAMQARIDDELERP